MAENGLARFHGRVAIITGGASGIGRATAIRLASEGAETLILDRNSEGAREAARSIDPTGARAHAFTLDLRDEEQIRVLAADVISRFPAVHVLVNCAGVVHIEGKQESPFIERGLTGWDLLTETNLKGPAMLVHALLPALIAGRGAIVNISSEAAFRSRSTRWIYDLTKAAVLSLTRSLAASLAPFGVRVNSLAPGGTVTEMHLNDFADADAGARELRAMEVPNLIGRLAEPHEIAAAIAFLASDDASFVTGTTLAVDGGGQGSR